MLMVLSAIVNGVTGTEIGSGLQAASGGGTPCVGVDCIPLAEAGEDFDYVGASGDIMLDKNGDPTAATYDIWQWTGDEAENLSTVDFRP